MRVSLSTDTQHFLYPLQLSGPRTDSHTLEESYVELEVDSAVEVPMSRGYASVSLQHPEVLGGHSKSASCLTDVMCCAIHKDSIGSALEVGF